MKPTAMEEQRRDSLTEGTSLLHEKEIQNNPNMVESCTKYPRYLVDVLACVFGISAWLCVNGMFTQLPILVQNAPEGWTLPSYLSILIQIANIGPISYSILNKCAPNAIRDSVLIYVILMLGTTAVLFMAFFYSETTIVLGVEHSTPLFILTFCVAIVGCTSSVLFIPFMNNYPEIHLVSYLVGEGLSGFIPSVISLIQGIGVTKCINTTLNGTVTVHPEMSEPWFSSQLFLIIMFFLMCASTISFILLNKLPSCKRVKLINNSSSVSNSIEGSENNLPAENDAQDYQIQPTKGSLSPALYVGLLFLMTLISVFANGALPSVQSYSTLPYGSNAYHLAVNLASMANPAACFAAFFLPHTSLPLISIMSVFVAITTTYNVTTAFLSPSPPLQHELLGEILIVSSWVLCCGLTSYTKLSIAALFRREGGSGLFWYGACTQAGAAVGALTSFYLVNSIKLLKSYNPCQ